MKQEKINKQEKNISDVFKSFDTNISMFKELLHNINTIGKGAYIFLKHNTINNDGVLDYDDTTTLNILVNDYYLKFLTCLNWKNYYLDGLLKDILNRLKTFDFTFNKQVNALSFFNDGNGGNAIYTNGDKPIRELLLFRLGSIKNIKDTITIFVKTFYNLKGIVNDEKYNLKPMKDILNYSFNPYKEIDKNTSGLILNQLLGIIAKTNATLGRVNNIIEMTNNTKNKLQEHYNIFNDDVIKVEGDLDDDDIFGDATNFCSYEIPHCDFISDCRENEDMEPFDNKYYLDKFITINGMDDCYNDITSISIDARETLNHDLYKHYFFNKMGEEFGLCRLDDDIIGEFNIYDIIDSKTQIDNIESFLFDILDDDIDNVAYTKEIEQDIEKRKQEIYKEMENK